MHGPAAARAGGIILWEYCSWPSIATCRAKLPSANPYFCPITGCLIISAAWRSVALHLGDVDILLAKFFSKFFIVINDAFPMRESVCFSMIFGNALGRS